MQRLWVRIPSEYCLLRLFSQSSGKTTDHSAITTHRCIYGYNYTKILLFIPNANFHISHAKILRIMCNNPFKSVESGIPFVTWSEDDQWEMGFPNYHFSIWRHSLVFTSRVCECVQCVAYCTIIIRYMKTRRLGYRPSGGSLDGRSMQNEGRGGGGIRSVVKTSLCLEIDTISSVIVNHWQIVCVEFQNYYKYSGHVIFRWENNKLLSPSSVASGWVVVVSVFTLYVTFIWKTYDLINEKR